jgi:hypothetical protein
MISTTTKAKRNGFIAPSKTAESAVHATLNYTKSLEKPTEVYFYENEASKDAQVPGDDPQEVAITSGWHRAKEFSTDKEGFALSEFHTSFSQWDDDEAVKQHFYPEVTSFLKGVVGAKRVVVFDHTIRTKKHADKKLTEESDTSKRAPVMLVHCDYTADSGPARVHQLLGAEADDLLSRRVAFFNIWKPIHNKVEERPLTMCDVTSSPDTDFAKLTLHYRDRTGENYVMKHSTSHKWWYFPGMTTEQVILLKTYESETDGRARFVGHTAFVDPTSPPDAPVRESVEIRTMAFY